MSPVAAVVLAVAAAGAVAAAAWPFLGLLTYLWFDFMRPHDSWVVLRAYRPMLVLGAVTTAAALWQQRRQLLDRWLRLLPLLVLAAAVALNAVHSSDPATSAGVLLQVLKMLALVWLMSVLVTTDARFQATLWVIALSLLVLAVGAVVQGVEHGLLHEFQTALVIEGPSGNHDGEFGDNNFLARVLVLSVPLWWALASRVGPVWVRVVAAAGFVTTVAGIVFTFSRGGFVALIAVVVVVSCFYRPWWRAFVIPPLFIALLLVLAPRPYLDRVLTITRPMQEGSVQGRLEIWKGSLDIARKDPVLGQGAGTLRVGAAGRPSHNVFIEVLAETGMVGMAAYIWMLLATFRALHRVRRSAVGIRHAADLRTASVGLEAALFGYLTAGLALSGPFQSPLFALIGLTLALQRHVEATEAIGADP